MKDIQEFEKKYKGSKEEIEDIKKSYLGFIYIIILVFLFYKFIQSIYLYLWGVICQFFVGEQNI